MTTAAGEAVQEPDPVPAVMVTSPLPPLGDTAPWFAVTPVAVASCDPEPPPPAGMVAAYHGLLARCVTR